MLVETKGDIPTTFMHALEDNKRLNSENQKLMDEVLFLNDEVEKLKNLLRQSKDQQTFIGR